MLNNLVLMGRLTKDPQLKRAGEKIIVVNFDIAVDNIRKEADGTRGTSFFSVVCFNTIAENVAQHLHKGSKVAVVGSIQQRNFIRKDGTKGSVYEVTANSVEFLDPKPESEQIQVFTDEDGEEALASASGIPDEEVELDLPDDDLPFKGGESQPQKQPKFDPFTGKPLKPANKK